ncbi:hypothetical protein Baya_13693 [Bagarius yarrelli]|uniref:Uncharacterized protein n=1 Tax=Bagarius yarrelli TaxID=175774 RepID=A0A556V6P4_BAGYA|nr:hypothetical protein Baya_13693 [Bagarius yarrelli]
MGCCAGRFLIPETTHTKPQYATRIPVILDDFKQSIKSLQLPPGPTTVYCSVSITSLCTYHVYILKKLKAKLRGVE